MRAFAIALAIVLAVPACNCGEAAVGESDAGVRDAGALDSGMGDAGDIDAGPTDGGPEDAGELDAGPMDAGPEDAGEADAGPEDAGCFAGDDGGCPPVVALTDAQVVCSGNYQPPTVVAADGVYAVGCNPMGSQNVTPEVHIVDAQGTPLATHALYTADGYYYTDIQLGFHDGLIQALYEYNCDDNGSWQVGWGWNCIDRRVYARDGGVVSPSLVYGETGHNGHPVLAWSGSGFGTAWVSYDALYFRALDANADFVDGGPGDNVLVAGSNGSDARNDARTKIAWSAAAQGYGVFAIIGTEMYFARVGPLGDIQVPATSVVGAWSQTFSGQFDVIASPDGFFVCYFDGSQVHFMKTDLQGSLVFNQVIQSGDFRFPTMFEADGLFYVTSNDANRQALLIAVDSSGSVVPERSVTLSPGTVMAFPMSAYEAASRTLSVVSSDDTAWSGGNISLRHYHLNP